MAKKKRSSQKRKEQKAPETPPKVNAHGQEDTRPDFGGLPDIDFKKNLGCG